MLGAVARSRRKVVLPPSVLKSARRDTFPEREGRDEQNLAPAFRDAHAGVARIGVVMRPGIFLAGGLLLFFGTLYAFQKPFKEYSGTEYFIGDIPLPPDWNQKTDFVFARLMFPGGPLDGYQRTGRFTGRLSLRVVAVDPGLSAR